MTTKDTVQTVAIVGAVVIGIWALFPVAVGVMAAFLVILYYGLTVFAVPAWALGIGAASSVLTGGMCVLIRGDARSELVGQIVTFAKMVAVLFVATGAFAALNDNMPALQSLDPGSSQAQVEASARETFSELPTLYAWLVLVVMPMVLAALSVRQAFVSASRDRPDPTQEGKPLTDS